MSFLRIEQIKNGDSYVPFYIFQCDITGEEIPENNGWYGNTNTHISENGIQLLIEDWISRNGNTHTYPIFIEYLIKRLTCRRKYNRYISKELKKKVLAKYKHKCVLCGATKKLEIDHIKPISKNGLSELKNLQILCKTCNLKKGNKT